MNDRLRLIGGAGRYLNLFAAMKIGGFSDPAEIYQAIKTGEVKCNENLWHNHDPTSEKSWIQIETESYLKWLDGRLRLSADIVYRRLDIQQSTLTGIADVVRRFQADNKELAAKLARSERYLSALRSEIAELKLLLFENLRDSRIVTQVDSGRRRKAV